jgi:hypothetical protein
MDTLSLELVPKSKAQFFVETCGPYLLPLCFAALIAFALTLLLLKRGRTPAAWAALVLVVPMPMLVGLFATLSNSHDYWASTPMDATVLPVDLAVASGKMLIPLWAGLILSAPTYLVAVIGLLIRSFGKDERGSP